MSNCNNPSMHKPECECAMSKSVTCQCGGKLIRSLIPDGENFMFCEYADKCIYETGEEQSTMRPCEITITGSNQTHLIESWLFARGWSVDLEWSRKMRHTSYQKKDKRDFSLSSALMYEIKTDEEWRMMHSPTTLR